MSYSKYYLYKKQYSTDNGVTWYDVTPAEQVPSGNPIGTYSTLSECESDVPHDYSGDYLTFVAIDSGTFTFYQMGKGILQYSTDSGSTWTTLTNAQNTHATTVSVSAGNKILWKGTLYPDDRDFKDGYRIGQFNSTGKYNIEGNLTSITNDGPVSVGYANENYQFEQLFGYNKIVNAGNMVMPYISVSQGCFYYMFNSCTYLTTPPSILPATDLRNCAGCYQYMFFGCTSLTTAPELPATILSTQCYYSMFFGCSSLTTAPDLPATALTYNCYESMFEDCSSLNSITCLATNISANNCTKNWVNGVASSGTFTKAASMSSWPRNSNGIPSNWTVQNAS